MNKIFKNAFKQLYIDPIYIIVFVFIALLAVLWYYESEQFIYHINCLFKPALNKKGLPTPFHIRQYIYSLIDLLPERAYTIVDFGCGDGDFIQYMHSTLPDRYSFTGIEMESDQANKAIQRFAGSNSIEIKHMNMVDYIFPDTSTILYMYEPLWTLTNQKEINSIYSNVIYQIKDAKRNNSDQDYYIIYLTAAIHPLLDESFFTSHDCTVMHHSRMRRFVGYNANHVYLISV